LTAPTGLRIRQFLQSAGLGSPSNAQRAVDSLLERDVIDRDNGSFLITRPLLPSVDPGRPVAMNRARDDVFTQSALCIVRDVAGFVDSANVLQLSDK
jgi:hypothetical protein